MTTTEVSDLQRILESLRDALLDLEVWRQNVRTAEERDALRRMATALGDAHREMAGLVAAQGRASDPRQEPLPL